MMAMWRSPAAICARNLARWTARPFRAGVGFERLSYAVACFRKSHRPPRTSPTAACRASRCAESDAATTCRRACPPDADHTVFRRAGNPRTAFGANPPRAHPPAVGTTLEWTRLDPVEVEAVLRDNHPHREGAAGQARAIPAVAQIDRLRRFGDLVANFLALTAAGLGKVHGNTSRLLVLRSQWPQQRRQGPAPLRVSQRRRRRGSNRNWLRSSKRHRTVSTGSTR